MTQTGDFASRTHYHYRISLNVRHPHIAPEKITKALGIQPKHSGQAGEPRQTPKGKLLGGSNQHTHWGAEIAAGRWPSDISTAIHDALTRLTHCRSFLRQIRAEDGKAELFIGWFFESQSGDVLTHECLALAGDLQIDLSFDIYASDHPQNDYEVRSYTLR